MNLKELILFGMEESQEPVIKNPILQAALREPRPMAQGGRLGYQSGQLVQPGFGRQGYNGEPKSTAYQLKLGPGPYKFTTKKGDKGLKYFVDGKEVSNSRWYRLKSGESPRKLTWSEKPGLKARAIELLNDGLTKMEVAKQIEKEGIHKFGSYFNKPKNEMQKSYSNVFGFFDELLEDGELNIKKISTKTKDIVNRDTKLLNIINNNSELNSQQLAKKASANLGYKINQSVIIRLAKNEGIDLVSRHAQIFPQIEYLDQLIKKNQNYISYKQNDRKISRGRYRQV